MRPIYLAALPVGISMILAIIPSLIILIVMGSFSKGAKFTLGELTGEKR